MAKATTTNTVTSAPAVTGEPVAYLQWGPIFAGGVVATAISIVLFQFAAAAGVAGSEPLLSSGDPSWAVLPAGLWIVFTALAASAGGGYIAGRMRAPHPLATEHQRDFRDGTHGLVVWALGTLMAVLGVAVLGLITALGAAEASSEAAARSDAYLRIAANASVITGFASAAGAALGAAAGWFFAVLGGNHRDENIDVDLLVPSMFRRRT